MSNMLGNNTNISIILLIKTNVEHSTHGSTHYNNYKYCIPIINITILAIRFWTKKITSPVIRTDGHSLLISYHIRSLYSIVNNNN